MGFKSVMAVVVADNFPVQRSSCIVCGDPHRKGDMFLFWFSLAEQITIFAPLELFPVSCSFSQLS